jgi:ribonucleoside-triphosphate reductase
MQLDWFRQSHLPWRDSDRRKEAEEMYDRIFNMKFLPPGRGLWAMGSPITTQRKLFAALNNCAFISTKDLAKDKTRPFCFLMDASMLGVGVGFDTAGASQLQVALTDSLQSVVHVVEDSREGWVHSLDLLLRYLLIAPGDSLDSNTRRRPVFDYSKVRPKGAPIKGFGGKSQGPEPLMKMHSDIGRILVDSKKDDFRESTTRALTVTDIVDVMNLIGKCVVSGNVRRTAEIAFGDPTSEEYISLKDYSVNPHRGEFGWTSNNSVLANIGMDYTEVCKRVILNGEPGFAWLQNMQQYSRMCDPVDNKDNRALGGNPCLEQTLESGELCCLVETFPNRHDDLEDYLKTLQLAVTYAKTVTLGHTHWPESNAILLRNRRIGTSMSGIAQFVANRGLDQLKEWCERGYAVVQDADREVSERFTITRSVKTTCIKPSGTVSLLTGATPGMHFPESRFYIRRVRMDSSSDLLPPLERAGYIIEDCVSDPNTKIVQVPIDSGEGVRTAKNVTMWEQLSLASFLQKYWADNQVLELIA